MLFEKTNKDTLDLYEKIVPPDTAILQKKMFGYPVSFIAGNMCVGIHGNTLFFRLPEEKIKTFVDQKLGSIFEPMPEHQMKDYVVPNPELLQKPESLAPWIEAAISYTKTLSPKIKKQ